MRHGNTCPRCLEVLIGNDMRSDYIHTCTPSVQWWRLEQQNEALKAQVAKLKADCDRMAENYLEQVEARQEETRDHWATIEQRDALKAQVSVLTEALEKIRISANGFASCTVEYLEVIAEDALAKVKEVK